VDWVIEVICVIGVLILITLPIIYYNQLPDIIPTHYDSQGKADGHGAKSSIWMLPILGTLMYLLMLKLNQYPHIFNYQQKITEQNAEKQYTIATRMLRIVNVSVVRVFTYLTYSTIWIAMGKHSHLSALFTPLVCVSVFVLVGFSIYISTKKE